MQGPNLRVNIGMDMPPAQKENVICVQHYPCESKFEDFLKNQACLVRTSTGWLCKPYSSRMESKAWWFAWRAFVHMINSPSSDCCSLTHSLPLRILLRMTGSFSNLRASRFRLTTSALVFAMGFEPQNWAVKSAMLTCLSIDGYVFFWAISFLSGGPLVSQHLLDWSLNWPTHTPEVPALAGKDLADQCANLSLTRFLQDKGLVGERTA